MNTLDKMEDGSSTHIRLFSGNVKNFDLYKVVYLDHETYDFGFTMKKDAHPIVNISDDPDENNTIFVRIDREGLDSLIDFLNRLREEI